MISNDILELLFIAFNIFYTKITISTNYNIFFSSSIYTEINQIYYVTTITQGGKLKDGNTIRFPTFIKFIHGVMAYSQFIHHWFIVSNYPKSVNERKKLLFVTICSHYIMLCQLWRRFYGRFLNGFYDSSLNKISSIFDVEYMLSNRLLLLGKSQIQIQFSWFYILISTGYNLLILL